MNALFSLTGMEETTIKGLEILYIIADLDSKQPILHKHSRDYFKPYNLVQYLFMSFIFLFSFHCLQLNLLFYDILVVTPLASRGFFSKGNLRAKKQTKTIPRLIYKK